MTADALANIIDAVTHVRDAGGRHPFEHAVNQFTEVLGRVPDTAPADTSLEEIGLLQTFSEEVIERIEARVARAAVCGPHEQMLIIGLYEIRRLLEEIHRWRQHFATGGHHDPAQLGARGDGLRRNVQVGARVRP